MASMAIRIFFAFILSLPAMWFAGWAFLDYRKKKTSARPFSNDTVIKSHAFHSPYPLETITLNRIDAALWRENAESQQFQIG